MLIIDNILCFSKVYVECFEMLNMTFNLQIQKDKYNETDKKYIIVQYVFSV